MKVIGTAGHVDHGKSTLVRALTGIDPDRLAEEKAREMTIDLGFAWLALPNGESVGVIDVPGHIDFIKNMLAGVGGIDAALFVIAADEGVMPQTQEHLAILDLLQVQASVVALTKIDMVQSDPEWLDLVQADVAETLAATCLRNAPIIPVSARTGQGLAELVAALQATLQHVPERPDLGRPRLPIDRSFSVSGFGTIVTGTLSDGHLAVGQEVEIAPAGLKARVRGLQTHKRKLDAAVPGSRVAVNLSGINKEQVNRGDVVCLPDAVRPTILVDVHLRMLRDVPHELRHNQPVDFFCGAAEVESHTRLLDAEVLVPGASGWVQLRLARPVAVQRGDRFILRQASPSRTLGGGVVVNPYPGRRWRRFRPEVIAMLEALRSGEPPRLLEQALRSAEPASFATLAASSGLDAATTINALQQLAGAGKLVILDKEWSPDFATASDAKQRIMAIQAAMSDQGWRDLQARITAAIASYHRQYPLRQGMPREELKSRLQGRRRKSWALRQYNDIVAAAAVQGCLVEEGSLVRLPDHAVQLSSAQQTAVNQLLALFAASPTTPPNVTESLAVAGEDLLAWLVDSGQLVRVSEDVVLGAAAYGAMLERIMEHLRSEGTITVAQVRDICNTSRKFALALMEHLDARRITRRVGDARVLRRNADE